MKRVLLSLLIILTGAAGFAAAEAQYTPEFGWLGPRVLSQGGAFAANGQGFETLMSNPASFTVPKKEKTVVNQDGTTETIEKGEVTVLALQVGAMLNPFQLARDIEGASDGGQVDMQALFSMEKLVPLLFNQLANNEVGLGLMAGGGYVGKGVGAGLVLTGDVSVTGQSLLAAKAAATVTVALPIGYAHKFELGRDVSLSVGGDIRPMYRMQAEMGAQDLLMTLVQGGELDFNSVTAMHGFGIGVDLGVLVQWSMLNVGVAFRDLGTTFWMNPTTIGSFVDGTVTSSLMPGSDSTLYRTPPSMRVGVGFKTDFEKVNKWFRFQLQAEYDFELMTPESTEILGIPEESPWTKLGVGAEILLLNHIALRAGYYQGYFSGGLGLDLWFAQINAAFFAEEGGAFAGEQPNFGTTLEFAIRF